MNPVPRFSLLAPRRHPWAALLLLVIAAGAQAAPRGELWENTTTMESAGGRMELGAHRDCHPLNWLDGPEHKPQVERGCRSDDFERLAHGYRWSIRCEDGRSGTVTTRKLDRDRVDTDMAMDTPDGHFVLHIESRRVGTCSNPDADD